jgi:hypothetical protein
MNNGGAPMGEESTVYVAVRGARGQLVVSGPLALLRELLASVREPPGVQPTAAPVQLEREPTHAGS